MTTRRPISKQTNVRSTSKSPGSKRGGRTSSASKRPANKSPDRSRYGGPLGVGLLLVGVLAGLGTYVDLAGPVGRLLHAAAQGSVGAIAIFIPVVLVGVGLVRLVSHDPENDELSDGDRRVIGGVVLAVIALDGLLHLAWGPQPGDGIAMDDLHGAGGLVGLIVTAPGQALLGIWGAGFMLIALGIGGGLAITGITASKAARWVLARVRDVARSMRRGITWAMTLSDRHGVTDGDDEGNLVMQTNEETVIDLVKPRWRNSPGDESDDATIVTGNETTALTISLPPSLSDESYEDESDETSIAIGPQNSTGEVSAWVLPPVSLLVRSEAAEIDVELVEEGGRSLESALRAHGVETRLVGMTVGPTVTRYELELGDGVKVARVTSLHKDIAYAMASPDVRILAPIPGRSAIGVEVPNRQRQLVALGDILTSEEARKATHPCEVALGRDIAGRAVMANLAEMPHILIAGATGAGKSSCLNSLLTSLLVRSTPDQVRLILIDPKRVELGQYNHLPHLLTEVVVNPKKAANALSWAVKEMERRYDLLSEVGVRDITGYNQAFDEGELRTEARAEGVEDAGEPVYSRLPFIVIVIDELNDLMMVAARDVEDSICRIAQMARAVGIHLVIATQRPSVNVITGVIKANVPARLAFAVSSLADSRVILDQAGAERLIGQGDMLLLGASSSIPRRIQGAWVGEDEVREVVAHWKAQSPEVTYDQAVVPEGEEIDLMGGYGPGDGDGDDDASLLWQAMELVVRSQLGSTSMLQRKLRVGFARAGRLMDLLEMRGVVGPSTGSKARDVLMTVEELDELLASGQR
ncbi:MAG: DNA translocase FtsK [Acidimicrobiales bacterium]